MKKKDFIIGMIIGLVVGTLATAYAAQHITLVGGNNIELGTASNPIYVTSV